MLNFFLLIFLFFIIKKDLGDLVNWSEYVENELE
jgi:hypothetical protein